MRDANADSELEMLYRIDRICDEFEDALNRGLVPQIEEFVTQAAVSDRTVLQHHLQEVQDAWLQRSADSSDFPSSTRFQFRKQLGAGSFGRVFLALDRVLQRLVAIKIPLAQEGTAEDLSRLADFALAEARRVAALDHPVIVPVLDVLREDGVVWVVSKYAEGESLSSRLTRGPLPVKQAVDLTIKLAEALQQAHLKGLVHRDVKPSNIILGVNGEPHLLDFGLAAPVGQPGRAAEGFTGTLPYLPPEALTGTAEADPRLDIYAMGVVLYQMLTGTRPYPGTKATMPADIEAVAQRAMIPRATGVDRSLEAVCLRAISHDPAERQATAAEFAADLRRCRPVDSLRMSRRHWLAVAGCGSTVAALGTWFLIPGTTRVVISTVPAGATVSFVPVDNELAIVRAKARTCQAGEFVDLPPGDYRVVARLNESFHEVLRRIPPQKDKNPGALQHLRWQRRPDNTVELPKIMLPSAAVESGMLKLGGGNVPAFLLDPKPVTIADYRAVMEELPLGLRGMNELDESAPVTQVSFDEAVLFAEMRGKRLPEVAELACLIASEGQPPTQHSNLHFVTASLSMTRDHVGNHLPRIWHVLDANSAPMKSGTYSIPRQSRHTQLGIRLARSVGPDL